MPPESRKKKGRRRETAEEETILPVISHGHHIHLHEIHGRDMIRHLRRPYIVALGYRPES